jgi:hypothetical protein
VDQRPLALSVLRPLAAIAAVASAGLLVWGVNAGATVPVTPTPIGAGPLFQPGSSNAAVERGLRVGSLRCTRAAVRRWGCIWSCSLVHVS